jgi:hypothetical protein
MAMSGVPVIVSGNTHYRNRGFTIDPDSWLIYYKELGIILSNPKRARLREEQIKNAWAYAYRFFFNFPRPFPWHIHFLRNDYAQNSIKKVFSRSGRKDFGQTFKYLANEPMDWDAIRKSE